MSTINSKILQQQTTCKHCTKLLKDPRLLPCLHSYCKACLPMIVKENEEILCPTCNENHGIKDISNLPKDMLAESLILQGKTGNEDKTMCSSCGTEIEGVTQRCLSCSEFLCGDCSDIHRRLRQTRDHQIITLQQNKTENEQIFHRVLYCDMHLNEELR